ncbi:MAG: alpha/beta hydrolase [Enterococcus sp.]|uniref:alpha/beta hydrolase n=1 Tax=Enterococcus sp. TaxID=35783 RepID=UPI002647D3A0|nr:alpha/beta family hydrolase [Enterococcus sp.]MDN6004814.1 alpha/beta hydrolase [Enterococcus sp.]MDN6217493.1 alpha/beta hydrolase [Enterococcus sp.]MDN6517673.1 alpha/beta hydrolase [Enterococcus sp.]MDN6560667.1 alpha/beta hydrolase [Enterococcus sp.]MDN6615366.1 alpha/beta hydrolase [Enterococcus sp.]
MKKWKKILLAVLIAIVIVIVGGITYVKTQTYSPTSQAEQVGKQAKEEPDWLYFPSKDTSKPIVIFYPGALVEPESYSVWAKELADAGYPVYIMKMPLDLAVLAPDRGEKVLKEQPKRPFIMGGHSLGGVMASRFAKDHSDNLKGVFFLASYPDEKGRLVDSGIPVLSLTGENDHVLDKEAYQEAKKNLPEATEYQEIVGGNHAGFGAYGHQKGDGKSTISDQNQQVAQRLIQWLDTIK